MNDIFQALVGRQVQVYSVCGETEVNDTGTLEAYDGVWLCLRKSGEALSLSIARIRLVKPL